jgi:eukaryotic-like serine/threonine-protein kinase
MPPRDHAPRDLLFGLLALQNSMVNRDQLVLAFTAWTGTAGRALADLLVEHGALSGPRRALLDALVAEHLAAHGNDPEKSLAALDLSGSTRESLAAAGGPDVADTIAHVGTESGSNGVSDRTPSFAVGTATAPGQRFRVLRPHARGGLGAVFVALDSELNREVALKQILDHHADDPVIRTRFLVEAEITGGLEHPGIVPVYGLGTYADGRPYYAMRFVQGDSLKEAIRQFHSEAVFKRDSGRRSLAVRQLLRRFLDVCNAIDYAHSRGVLHRDIKPGNVIVGRHGETLVVDWGLAKATGQREPGAEDRTLVPSSASGSAETLPGSALGTPPFMSPEQARGDLGQLGPRSDVYSLGATLYCLLTGRPPFEGEAGEVIQRVQRGDFPPPRRLDPSLDPALEAVCLKAMAREPEDRYPSCQALADDVDRWLADEPVSARREPLARRARRWARRHRTAVAAAAVALAAGLVGLSGVAAVQAKANTDLRKANRQTTIEKDRAEQALVEAKRAKQATDQALALSEVSRRRAEAAERAAKVESEKATAINDFLTNDLLTQAEPASNDVEDRVTLREVLDRAAAKVGGRFTGHPDVEEAVRDTIARTYHGLGAWEPAELQWRAVLASKRRRLGPGAVDSVVIVAAVGHILHHLGRAAEAIELLEPAAESLSRALGPDDLSTLTTRSHLAIAYLAAGRANDAIRLNEETLRRREAALGHDHNDTLTSLGNLANAYREVGRIAEATAIDERTLKLRESTLGPDHPSTLTTRNNLAFDYAHSGRVAEAIRGYEQVFQRRQAVLGPDHPDTLQSLNNIAAIYLDSGRVAEAVRLHEQALKLRGARLGLDHPDTLQSLNNLASGYWRLGRLDRSVPLFEEALRRYTTRLGADHPNTLRAEANLGVNYRDSGRPAAGARLMEDALRRARGRPAAEVVVQGLPMALAVAYESLGRWSDAEAARRAALAHRRRTERPGGQQLPDDLDGLARNLLKQSRPSEAEPLARESLAIREKGAPDNRRFHTMSLLGGALLAQGKYAEAEPLVLSGYHGLKAIEAKLLPSVRYTLWEATGRVLQLYDSWGKPEQARIWAEKLGQADLPGDIFARP